jgi:restriction endonuclease S subunit
MNLSNLEIRNSLDRITDTHDLPEKFYVREDDIVISQMGTVGDIGVITDKEDGFLFASFTIRVRIKDTEKLKPYFVGLYIQSIAKHWYLARNIAQASVRQNTDLPTIRNMPIPMLNNATQQQIAADVQRSFALRRESERLLDTAKQAVEIAIEQSEDVALRWLTENDTAGMEVC